MTRADLPSSRVLAVLGPTNTGKTHFAVERMLAHVTGMMGFPLRLLAREVFDRVVALKGRDRVALFTGEEKVGPENAPYLIATVEAMPLQREVAFLGVDEIQLCADRERGHVFTDRLLHARGWAETVFLGSDTIRPLLKQLIPEAEIVTRPRFSVLSYTGAAKLHRLPRRSAVVAFSATDVYALAEVMRRQKGGAAVVLGALSPRTRNAQVAMFQSGEVEHLVATDAIGMGLNMDLAHVAFADLTKFDGQERRPLTPSEIGQIAGRAGRHMADGTFGTTNGIGPIDDRVVEAVENHHFAPLKQLRWRNADLDFGSLDALMASLDRPPPLPGLVKVRDALDDRSLAALARRGDVKDRATGERRVRLLWQVCQIPDFRKTLTDAHLHLLFSVYRHLTEGPGLLPNAWMARMLDRLERVDGDIDALVGRIAHTRTLTYLSHHDAWLADPPHWQGRAREVEDRLSDALHERLTQKFVDRRTAVLMRSLREQGEFAAVVEAGGEVVVDGERVGRVQGLVFTPEAGGEAGETRLFAGPARRAAARELVRLASEAARSPDDAFALDAANALVCWRGAPVARIVKAPRPLRVALRLEAGEEVPAGLRAAVLARCERWVDDWLARRIGPLQDLAAAAGSAGLSGAARGLAYRIVEGLGTLPQASVEPVLPSLAPADRAALARLGVRMGLMRLYMPALLKPAAAEALALLVAPENGAARTPPPGRTVLRGDEIGGAKWQAAMGYLRLGPVAVRVDLAERLAAALRALARAGEGASFPFPAELAASCGLKRDEFLEALPDLGFRAVEREGATFVVRRQRRRERCPPAERKAIAARGRAHSPFAALVALKTAR
ncbi:MAG: disulfide oxidoreductase [Geminicoccaceae bacterium]|nr:disulfide oxidoreductase [Geminicoccaceae bacterium]